MSKFRSRLELLHPDGKLILSDAFDVRVREVVNEDFYTQFIYPKQPDDSERYEALINDVDVQFPPDVERGQIFRIKKTDEVRQGKKIYKVVEAHHVAFTLGQYFLDDYIDFQAAVPIETPLSMLAADTPFTFAIEGNFAPQDIFDWGEKSKLELLHEIRKLYGAELSFDNYTITLTTRKGGNHGAQVRYRHNLKGIERHSHTMERVTRLYGYGKNGLTIEGYNGHTVKYIDSEYFDPNNPFMGKVEFPDIDDQGRLLQEMQKHLKTVELPKVSYNVDFVQMEKVDPEFESEWIREAGDTVTVYDDELGYHFDARAIEFERYPFEPKRGHVVLTNFREFKTSDYIFQATVGSKKAIQYTSKNAVLKGVKYDDSITLVDGLGMKVTDDFNRERVRIGQTGPGEYGLAMYNKDGEKTIWQDAATGDAIFSGSLDAAGGTFSGKVEAGEFDGGTITGALIHGGTITGSTIQTSAAGIYPRIELNSSSSLLKAENGPDKRIELLANYVGTPAILFESGGGLSLVMASDNVMGVVAGSKNLQLSSTNTVIVEGDDVQIASNSIVNFLGTLVSVPSWTQLYGRGNGQTLQSALNAKANNFFGINMTLVLLWIDNTPIELTFSNGILVNVAVV